MVVEESPSTLSVQAIRWMNFNNENVNVSYVYVCEPYHSVNAKKWDKKQISAYKHVPTYTREATVLVILGYKKDYPLLYYLQTWTLLVAFTVAAKHFLNEPNPS